jgi:hypothetical protein
MKLFFNKPLGQIIFCEPRGARLAENNLVLRILQLLYQVAPIFNPQFLAQDLEVHILYATTPLSCVNWLPHVQAN